MKFTIEQRQFLKKFFNDNLGWIKEREMLDPDEIKQLADLYFIYLNNSEFSDNEVLEYFLLELKKSQLHELKIKKGEIKLTQAEKVFRMSVSASSGGLYKCKNIIIRKWYSESLFVRKITKNDVNSVNRSIEPKIKQNEYKRKLSMESAKHIVVK